MTSPAGTKRFKAIIWSLPTSACKELDSVICTENMSLSYDPFIESKQWLKMHVVTGNFIVASHESCHRSSKFQVSRDLNPFTIIVEEFRYQVEQKLQN